MKGADSMKKYISLLLSITIILTSFNMVTFASEDAPEGKMPIFYVFQRDFDGNLPGTLPPETTLNGNIIEARENPVGEGNVLYWKSTNAVSGFTNGSVYTSQNLIFTFEVMYLDTTGANLTLMPHALDRRAMSLVSVSGNGNIVSPDGKVLEYMGVRDRFTRITVDVDIKSGICDYYVDGVKKASQINTALANFTDVGEIRLNLGGGEGYIDNFYIYSAKMPTEVADAKGIEWTTSTTLSENGMFATDEELRNYMKDSLAVCSNKGKYYYGGKVSDFGEDVYVYDKKSKKGYINTKFAKEVFGIDESGEMMDANLFAEKAGLIATLDKCGLAAFSDRENFFDYGLGEPMFYALSKALSFDDIPAVEMMKLFSSRYEPNEHPRLIENKEGFERIMELSKTDPHMKEAVEKHIATAEKSLNDPTIELGWDTQNTNLGTARNLVSKANSLGKAYQLTGDERFAAKLWEHVETVCNFEEGLDTWHFLTTGEYLYGLGVSYDWIYDWMNDEQRKFLRDTIVQKGLIPAIQDYEDDPTRSRSFKWAQVKTVDNWVTVCNSGVVNASLAIYEDEPEIALKCLDYAMQNIKRSVVGYGPDGAWLEGTTYWAYNSIYYMYFIDTLDSVFGTDFGYMDAPGFDETVDFLIAIHGDHGTFNFGDANQVSILNNQILFYADKKNNPSIQNYFFENVGGLVDIHHYRPDFSEDAEMTVPLDYYARGVETVMMHSEYSKNAIFTALHSGPVTGPHSQWDCGNIVIDAYGSNFIYDLGSAEYSHRPQNYLYRKRAEGHNVPVINPDFFHGQDNAGRAVIDRFESNAGGALAITDISEAYQRDAESVVRGLMLTDSRETIILQDEFKMKEKSELYWFMHSGVPITVSADGKSATFHGQYKNMKATLLSDVDGKFEVMPAFRLESSPVPFSDKNDSKVNKLALHLEGVKDVTISVAFTFHWPELDEPVSFPVVPLKDWSLDSSSVYEKPLLSDLTVDGVTIDGFKPKNQLYSKYYDAADGIPVIDAKGNGEISVKYPETPTGNAYVTIKGEGGQTSVYAIKLVAQELKTLENGSKQFFIYSLSASQIDQAENGPDNIIDGNIETRYACMGTPYLTFDIGEIKTITDMGLAVWQGGNNDGRKQTFEVSVSTDGETFEHIFTGETTGTTLEQEYYQVPSAKCRYIRVTFTLVNGTTGGWNSPTEISFFGK